MSYPFAIFDGSGKEVSINETYHRQFLEEMERFEKQFDVELPQIKYVRMGNESNPIDEIHLPYDIILFGSRSLGNWQSHNEEQIQLYKLRR